MKSIVILLLLVTVHEVFCGSYLFEENKGQWHPDVLFRTEIPGGYLFITKTGTKSLYIHPEDMTAYFGHDHGSEHTIKKSGVRMQAIEVNFDNISSSIQPVGHHPEPSYSNYFYGSTPDKWVAGVKKYSEVWVKNIYDGIHARYYRQEGNLKYDLVVEAGSDPSKIKIIYKGASEVKLTNGRVEVKTDFGTTFELQPLSFQEIGARKSVASSRYVLRGDTLSFDFPDGYDRRYPLVIDPTLIFSTYSGSLADNWGFTATYDDEGNLYSGGIVRATGFPVTTGAFQENYGGFWDIGILKFDSLGNQLLYATYLGGSQTDIPHSLIVNHAGELVIYGSTSSTDFPITTNAFQTRFAGGRTMDRDVPSGIVTENLNVPVSGVPYNNGSDMFIAKLSEDGRELTASTFLGGSENDGVMAVPYPLTSHLITNYGDAFRGEVVVDQQDNIYVASYTSSTDFPIVNAFQGSYGGGVYDGVAFKMDPGLTQIIWSSFVGGSGQDGLYSVRLDSANNLIAGGGTLSADFPVTAGSYMDEINPTNIDGVIVKIQNDGSRLIAGTFLGTTSYDQVYLIDLDAKQNIYALGQTQGPYPVSNGVYSNPNSGQFIHKLNSDLDSSFFSTVFGSGRQSPNIRPTAFLVNECENLLISGWGGNTNYSYIGGNTYNLPITDNAFQKYTDGSDFYLMVLLQDAKELVYGTYIGEYGGRGDHVDGGTSRFDKRGIVYQSVCASCGGTNGFPTTQGAWSSTNNSMYPSRNCNNAVLKFDLTQLEARLETNSPKFDNPGLSAGCWPLEIVFLNKSIGGRDYYWDFGNGQTSTKRDSIFITYQDPGVYPVLLRATDMTTCIREAFDYDTITVFDQNFDIIGPQNICHGDSIKLNAEGGIAYHWEPALYLDDPLSGHPVAKPDTTMYFTVTISNESGCVKEDSTLVTILPNLSAAFSSTATSGCPTFNVGFINESKQGKQFMWDFGNGETSTRETGPSISYYNPGVYTVSLVVIDTLACPRQDTAYAEITVFDNSHSSIGSQTICFGSEVQLFAEGGVTYQWSPPERLSDPHSRTPVAKPDKTTDYYVDIINQYGCFMRDSMTITVAPDFTVDFSMLNENSCNGAPVILFNNESSGAETFLWDLGNGFTTTDTSFMYSYPETGDYRVTLTGIRDICEKAVQAQVRSVKTFMPNVITPNGDGRNESFELTTAGAVNMVIYNRWGGKVFERERYANEFNAEGLPAGVYYYKATFIEDGSACQGWLHVLK